MLTPHEWGTFGVLAQVFWATPRARSVGPYQDPSATMAMGLRQTRLVRPTVVRPVGSIVHATRPHPQHGSGVFG